MFRLLIRLVTTESASLLLVGRLGATLLAFVTAPIIARAIGPEGRGETAAAIALFNLVPIILAIGIPLEVRRLSALGHAEAAVRAARLVCVCAIPVSAVLGFLASVAVFASFPPSARLIASLGVAASPLMMMWTCDLSVLIAAERYRGVMILQLLQPLAYLALIVTFALAGELTTGTALVANITGTAATFIAGVCLTRVGVGGPRVPLRDLLRGGLKFAGSSIAETASSRLDQVLALPLIGAFQAGLYSVAVTVASIPMALGQALGATYFPLVARASGPERETHKAAGVRSAISLAFMTAPIILVGAWIGIPLLFGEEFSDAVPVAWISGFGTCALIVGYVCSLILAAEGAGSAMTWAQVSSLIAGVGFLYLLAPVLGAIGAAIASTAGYLLLLALLLRAVGVTTASAWPRAADFPSAIRQLVRPRPPGNG